MVHTYPVTPVGWEGFMAAEVSGHYGGASTYPVTPVVVGGLGTGRRGRRPLRRGCVLCLTGLTFGRRFPLSRTVYFRINRPLDHNAYRLRR